MFLQQKTKEILSTFSNGKFRTSLLRAIPFWVASLITGLVAVGYTRVFNYSEGLLHHALDGRRWLIFILAPLNMLIGWLVVLAFAPGARGSGIPQVMAAIELPSNRFDAAISKLLSPRVAITKIVSSVFMVLGGAAIGREGPTIQIAGSIFRYIHKHLPASWPKLAKQNFIITGAAAGLAAAFNTPLGGVVFAIEELARIHVSFFRTALFTAVIIAGLTAQTLLGPYLYLGYPDVRSSSFWILPAVVCAAIIAGFLGALMCRWILLIMRWRRKMSNVQSAFFILIAGLIMAVVAYFISPEILGSGKEIMSRLLFTNDKQVEWHTPLLRMLGPIVCFNTGAAGGIFAPALSAGACIGGWVSGIFSFAGANANILILSGMVGFLTGVTRTPFTSAILVLEMTDRHSIIFHLMLAALVANMAALLVEKHSFYDQLKQVFLAEAREIEKAAGSD